MPGSHFTTPQPLGRQGTVLKIPLHATHWLTQLTAGQQYNSRGGASLRSLRCFLFRRVKIAPEQHRLELTTMAILKSQGTTPSERLLVKLCEQTFLGFWSYPNTYREQGGPKELCDLLVVSGNVIILFSDKSCGFPDTGNVNLDWSRWYRKTILESAEQIFGAERWLKKHPERVFLDNKCAQRLPLSLAHISNCRFLRIVVALGAQQRCRQYRGGSGSLILAPELSAIAQCDAGSANLKPFCIGDIKPQAGHFHVFDDFTLPLILKELDTIADFISYLEFKEALFNSKKVGTIIGEENLLALFLSEFVHTGEWKTLLARTKVGMVFDIKDGGWELFSKSTSYQKAQEIFQHSYVWDRIIQEFATHAFGGTLVEGSVATVAENEEIF